MARSLPEINAGSMADISFLMLIFFLVTTSMDTNKGLARRLPPMPEDPKQQKDKVEINRRNVLEVFVNQSDRLLVGKQISDVSLLKDKVIDFIVNPEMSEKKDTIIGGKSYQVSKGVVSLNNDRGTSYDMYIQVQNELVKAFNELRDNFSQANFGKNFAALTADQQDLVRKIYPQNISEAEPKEYKKK